MNNIIKKSIIILSAGLPLLALSQNVITNNTGGIGLSTIQATAVNVGTIINNITSWVSGLLIAVAVLFVIYAAYLYMTSEGDANKVAEASQYILWAVIATIVALASFGIIRLGVAVFGF